MEHDPCEFEDGDGDEPGGFMLMGSATCAGCKCTMLTMLGDNNPAAICSDCARARDALVE